MNLECLVFPAERYLKLLYVVIVYVELSSKIGGPGPGEGTLLCHVVGHGQCGV